MEKKINQTQRVRLSLLAVTTAAAVGTLSVLSTPVQTVNAQDIIEFILLNPNCERIDNKIECPGGIEAELGDNGEIIKLEAPGCEIKQDKNECPEVEEEEE
jgi:hypothetical protein